MGHTSPWVALISTDFSLPWQIWAFFRRARLFVGEKGQEVEWEVERKSNRAQAANWAEVGYDVVMGEFGLA